MLYILLQQYVIMSLYNNKLTFSLGPMRITERNAYFQMFVIDPRVRNNTSVVLLLITETKVVPMA